MSNAPGGRTRLTEELARPSRPRPARANVYTLLRVCRPLSGFGVPCLIWESFYILMADGRVLKPGTFHVRTQLSGRSRTLGASGDVGSALQRARLEGTESRLLPSTDTGVPFATVPPLSTVPEFRGPEAASVYPVPSPRPRQPQETSEFGTQSNVLARAHIRTHTHTQAQRHTRACKNIHDACRQAYTHTRARAHTLTCSCTHAGPQS